MIYGLISAVSTALFPAIVALDVYPLIFAIRIMQVLLDSGLSILNHFPVICLKTSPNCDWFWSFLFGEPPLPHFQGFAMSFTMPAAGAVCCSWSPIKEFGLYMSILS